MFEFFCFKTDYAVPDERPKGLYLKTFAIAAWSFCPTTWELMLLHYLPWISETFVSLWWQWVRFSAHQGFFLVLFASVCMVICICRLWYEYVFRCFDCSIQLRLYSRWAMKSAECHLRRLAVATEMSGTQGCMPGLWALHLPRSIKMV